MAYDGIVTTDKWLDSHGKLLPADQRCSKAARYLVRAWDPTAPPTKPGGRSGRYRNKSFPTMSAGLAWAQQARAEFITGTGSASRPLVSELGLAYRQAVENRVGKAPTQRYLDQLEQIHASMLAAGIDDLTVPNLATKVGAWLKGLKTRRSFAKESRPASESMKIKALVMTKALVTFARDRRLLAYDPLATLKVARTQTRRRAVFTIDELRLLVSDQARWMDGGAREASRLAVDQAGSQKAAALSLGIAESTLSHRLATPTAIDPWWPLVVLLIYTGMRSTEAAFLTWSMVRQAAGVIALPADHPGNKCRRERRIRIQPELAELLTTHLVNESAFVAGDGPQLALEDERSAGVRKFIARHGVEPAGRSAHCLRHSFCSLMTALGASPYMVMDMAGHLSTDVSRHYSAGAEEFIDQVRSWPRDELWPVLRLRSGA